MKQRNVLCNYGGPGTRTPRRFLDAPHFESGALFPESPVTTTSNRLSPLPHHTVRWHEYGHSRAERLTQLLTLDSLGVGTLSARILPPFRGAALTPLRRSQGSERFAA